MAPGFGHSDAVAGGNAPSIVHNLLRTDTMVIRRWKDPGPLAVVVSSKEEISGIVRSLSWKQGVMFACGYEWTIHFLSRGRLIDTARVRFEECDSARIHIGGKSYLLTPRFKTLLRRQLAKLERSPQTTTRIYNYFVNVAVAPKRALQRLRKHGLKGFLLEPNPERYPTTEVSLESQSAKRDDEAAERAATAGLEAAITKLKQSRAIRHSTPVRFSGSRGFDVTVEATIGIQPGKEQEVTRRLNRSDVLVGPIRRPTMYPIQVAHRGKLPKRQLQRMVKSIEGVQKIATFPCQSERCANEE